MSDRPQGERDGSVIDPVYLPFSREQLRRHFTGNADPNLLKFEKSATRYREFLQKHPDLTNITLNEAKKPRQIEKDETFWTAACLKALYEHPQFKLQLTKLLCQLYGATPPLDGLATWNDCLTGDIHLYFETRLPSPQTYVTWLPSQLPERQIIPYIRDAATRKSGRPLEGSSHVDALFVNPLNGFGLLIEAKVLSDIATSVSFDNQRNQLARNIDLMLERYTDDSVGSVISQRRPERSLLALLTPKVFARKPKTRLYGWLLRDYQENPESLARDLPHRSEVEWSRVSKRLGWLTFEMVEMLCPGACPWLMDTASGVGFSSGGNRDGGADDTKPFTPA